MIYEVEFYFEQQLQPELLPRLEATCPTHALNQARKLAKDAGAAHFNVSVASPRSESGQIELRSADRKRVA